MNFAIGQLYFCFWKVPKFKCYFHNPEYRPEFTVGKGERRARGGFTTYEDIGWCIRLDHCVRALNYLILKSS